MTELEKKIFNFGCMLKGFLSELKDISPSEEEINEVICKWEELENLISDK